jgi:methylmalonyl-CoA/ethylmalonyl-CoA epimerase
MQPRGIHHLGVAVENLDEVLGTYERLFDARIEGRETLDGQGVEAAALRVGDSRVELVAALADDTPVGRFLSRRGPGMHHVAYGVDDLADALEELAGKGAEVIDPEPHSGLYGPAAFIHPESVHGVLVELVAGG